MLGAYCIISLASPRGKPISHVRFILLSNPLFIIIVHKGMGSPQSYETNLFRIVITRKEYMLDDLINIHTKELIRNKFS